MDEMEGTHPAAQDLLLENQLCFGLYAASRRVIQSYAALLTRLDLTYPQYITLMVLWEHPRLTVSQIGEYLLLDSGTLTPLLKKLEKKGLITRTRSQKDERCVVVEITAAGEAVKGEALALLPSIMGPTGLSQQEMVDLRQSLKKLLGALDGQDGCMPSLGLDAATVQRECLIKD